MTAKCLEYIVMNLTSWLRDRYHYPSCADKEIEVWKAYVNCL